MANESPPFHESDENTTDSHESINEGKDNRNIIIRRNICIFFSTK